ncbi:AAA family ATPase [Deferribacteraceae bacterium V6Fe1]|nr:AAA family ATPase [Deferribacteraceae bacterium V6Fe1]
MSQIHNVFKFLKEFNELSNPIICEIGKQKALINLTNLPKTKEVWFVYETLDFENEKILEVMKPIINPCPKPDEEIIEWIDGKWQDISVEQVSYKEQIVKEILKEDNEVTYVEENFNDEPKRYDFFKNWIIKRNNWRTVELPKKHALDLYTDLFKLYSDIKKESESVELILGDGRIRWKTEDRIIDHHAILQKVILEFDSNKPSFVVKIEEPKVELYTPMLRSISSINQKMLAEVLEEINENTYHIADKANIEAIFSKLINVIDKNGKYGENFDPNHKGPQITHEPILFLRKRTLGFSMFIDRILEESENLDESELPYFFGNLIGRHKNNKTEEITQENWNQNGIDEDILFTLPANSEQLKILKFLNSSGAVLVQGPPGTGKTHTIANLIGHLLSEGKNILVTSHTEKALTVLKNKVFKELQSLCISLLSSASQRKEMDIAIADIAEKNTRFNSSESKKKIERLKSERQELIKLYRNKINELTEIRANEYKDIIYNNQTIKLIEAAKFIYEGKGKFDYINGETTDDTIGLPLSLEELEELYKSNEEINLEEEQLLQQNIDFESIWTEDIFLSNKEKIQYLNKELTGWEANIAISDNVNYDILVELLKKTKKLLEDLNNFEQLQYKIFSKSLKNTAYKSLWNDFLEELNYFQQEYESYYKIRLENEVEVPDEIMTKETLILLNDIISTNKENPVGLLDTIIKPKWKKIKNSIKINNNRPCSKADYSLVNKVIKYTVNKRKVYEKFKKLLYEVEENIEYDFDKFEENIEKIKRNILKALNWHNDEYLATLKEIKSISKNQDFFDTILNTNYSVESIIHTLENILLKDIDKHIKKIEHIDIHKVWSDYKSLLKEYKHLGFPFDELYIAARSCNYEDYAKLYRIVRSIYKKYEIFEKRKSLLEKLNKVAPDWANDIHCRKGVHGNSNLPENILEAWKWRQLSNQLNRLDKYNYNEIQKEITQLNESLMNNAKRLAYERAWYLKITNTSAEQNQAIEGWRQTVRQIGKGTGKSAPRLRLKARDLMTKCQSAIPVWIMSLNKVSETFDPRSNKFDVIIIDEASQADILALSVLYLGKQVIIVGDDEQVSPSNVGLKEEEINALIEQFIGDIPNNHLFNGKTSVYDMAKTLNFKPLMLTEHFRCLPEIIEFCNQLSYNGKIKPLRENSGVSITPPTVEYRVPNGHRSQNKVNFEEVDHIVSLICACIENPNYADKTFGVISMVGDQQAIEIDKLLQKYIEPNEYEKRKILCGTPPQFQGDERDVIFLSLVDSPNINGAPITLVSEDGRNDMYKKRYNVAVSRAKDQLWVVHSLNPEIDLKPDDIRLKLINHVRNPVLNNYESSLSKAESEFEKDVMKTLLNRGYKVTPQWKVGAYRIDMVVEDGKNKIAVECDGEKYHRPENLPNDLKRQAILERLGWRFFRIRGSEYYRNPQETMEKLYFELERSGIKPNFSELESNDTPHNDLLEEIKRRAHEIRLEWENENSYSTEKPINIIPNTVKEDAEDFITESKSADNKTKPALKYETKEERIFNENIQQENYIYTPKNHNKSAKQSNIFTQSHKFDFSKKKQNTVLKDKESINSLVNKNIAKKLEPLFDFRKKK